MTFADKLWDAMQIARARNPDGKMTNDQWKAIVTEQSKKHFGKKRGEATPTERGKIFNALALATGTRDPAQLTRNGAKAVRLAMRDIVEVCQGMNDEQIIAEIQRRAALYVKKWPDPRNLTAPAFAKYWAEFGGDRTRTAKMDIYIEPTGNWRTAAHNLWPDAKDWINPHDWDTIRWFDVASDQRKMILQVLFK